MSRIVSSCLGMLIAVTLALAWAPRVQADQFPVKPQRDRRPDREVVVRQGIEPEQPFLIFRMPRTYSTRGRIPARTASEPPARSSAQKERANQPTVCSFEFGGWRLP